MSSNNHLIHLRKLWRSAAIRKLGGKCVRCGFSDERALQIDHPKGDGYLERKMYYSNYTYYRRIALCELKGDHQLLCANCNLIKARENDELNGQRVKNNDLSSTKVVELLTP